MGLLKKRNLHICLGQGEKEEANNATHLGTMPGDSRRLLVGFTGSRYEADAGRDGGGSEMVCRSICRGKARFSALLVRL
jgi:hypothetical protein